MLFLLIIGLVALPCDVHGGFFCAQFRPGRYRATVDESAPTGTVVSTALAASNTNSSVYIFDGDTEVLHYDNNTGNILTRRAVSEFRGQTLQLRGKCNEYIPSLVYTISLDAVIQVEVNDENDPPVFINLPHTISVPEATTAGSIVYVVDAANPTDVDPFYNIEVFSIVNVTAADRSVALDDVFVIDTLGRVRLAKDLDYEEGHRELHIALQVKDHGSPPLAAVSYLHVYVNDSDDQTPKFQHQYYTASVIGEKPVIEECHPTSPALFAEDQDPVKKSLVRYNIKDGMPVQPWHWNNFFFLNAETGELCQRETIPRAVYKRGDQTVREGFQGFYNYTLVVESYQVDDRSKFDTATLQVNVIDQNIHGPTFRRRRYKAEIDEFPAVRAGTIVTTVAAEDEDYGQNSLFEYELVTNPAGAFWVDPSSGEIKVTRPRAIDREKNETITFKVRAKEISTNEKRFSDPDAVVEVTVLDDNDNKPKFRRPSYRFDVKDSLTVGTAIHKFGDRIRADDPDLGENGTIHFSILGVQTKGGSFSMKDLQRFKIDRNTGVIKLADNLRDLRRKRKFPQYNVMVKAEDQSRRPRDRLSSVVRVVVQVTEANDFPPYFERAKQVSHISEAAAIGSLITKLKARDADGDEDVFLKFRIVSGNEQGSFRVSDKGYMFTNRPLDRELRSSYTLTIEASDGVHTAEAILTVHVRDTNDHAPVFSQSTYDFTLSEDASTNHIIGKVNVTDKDEGPNGKLVLSLSGDHADLFGIKKNGDIYLRRRSVVLDRETTDRVSLQVRAEDLGQPPEQGDATIRIRLLDVNDNRPEFTKTRYITEITEESPGRNSRRKLVQLEDEVLAEDADKDVDNRNIVYSLRGVGTDVFMIDKKSGRVYIRETRLVDCEVKCDYKLKVVARDQGGEGLEGTADLIININDINDNKPTLSKNYTFRASPRAKVGSVIGDIDAEDEDVEARNRRVMYVLKDGGYGKFSIDFDSGRLILVDSLTREPQMETYNLTVEVMDTGVPRLSTTGVVRVQVPVNRKPTLGATQKVTVSEDARVGVKVGRVNVTDTDSLTYRLDQSDSVPFRVSSDGTISTTRRLDREDSEGYTLTIVVSDRGYPINTVTATVDVDVQDVNDNAPAFTFTRYSGEIVEDDTSPKRNQIVKMPGEITVTDGDGTEENRAVVLSLRGEGSGKFTIDSDTGIIRVKAPGSIDCEVKCFYAFKLHAQDQKGRGLTGQADILISVQDVNDNSPTFQPNLTFTLNSLTKVGAHVGSVKATDRDKKGPNNVVLHVLTEGGDGKFEVDPYTGSIKLQMPLLDEPRREEYVLHVSAFDFGNPSLSADTTVTINVPLNFEPRMAPKIAFSVEENVPVGSNIGQVAATDKNVERGEDDHLRYFIDEDTLAGDGFPFSINIDTGMISTKAALDKETADRFSFLVYVVDSLKPVYTSSSSVHVEVRDQNDSPPEFTAPEYVMEILEDDAGDTQQTAQISPSVGVTDIDTPLADIQFNLMGNGSDLFVIDPATGHIDLKYSGTMDSETQAQYNLTILASDGRFSSAAPLTVIVEDVNDNAPVFKGEVTLNVSSLTPVGSVLGQVSAVDADVTQQNNDVMYYIIKGGLDKFAVHPESGEIQVVASLMEDPNQASYSLTVRAADLGRPQKYSDTTVTIYVPINYQPQVDPVTEVHVHEDHPKGTILHTLHVQDPNVERQDGDRLNFFISEQSSQDIPFEIDRYTGALKTKSALDRETAGKYSFLVHVTDSKQPVYTASTTVQVTVTDVNDNAPTFAASSYKANVIEDDTTPGQAQVVYLRPPLKVTDEDSSSDQFVFQLQGAGSELFTIDANSGEITQREAGSLDGDNISIYNLTVSVDDGQYVSNVSLTVSVEDVNDHAPVVVGEKRVEVDPLSLPGDVAAVMKAEDLDQADRNKRVSYYLMAGGMDRFRIDETTGVITVASSLTEGSLQDQYDLQIRVVDHGYPQQSTDFTLVLDVPVNFPPRLRDSYSFRLIENVPEGTPVGEVVATDRNADKGEEERLSYFIDDTESPSLPFTIERDTGQLLTNSAIDREQQSEYMFSVLVTDSRSPVYTASSTVTVAIEDENDNAPVFSAPKYGASFPEDRDFTDDRELILLPKLSTLDPDGGSDQLDFRLDGDGSELFLINSVTGAIVVRKEANFDTEQTQFYNLTIVASDGWFSSAATLDINVEDINDNAPEFSYNTTIYLDPFAPLGSHAGDASAVDDDVTSRNSDVHYHLLGGGLDKFTIHEETGQLTLASSLMEDPKRSEYNVRVLAFDMGTLQQRTEGVFKIRVPVNYQPHFESVYRFSVKENVTVGSEFGQVMATDKNIEQGEDDRLSYFIDEKSTQGVDFPFYMNRRSGQLVISCVLDREKKDMYDFTVFVTDSKQPVYTASTLVYVTIDDVNDNAPQFGAASYTGHIQEDDSNPGAPRGVSVTPLVSATDADKNREDLTYSLEGPGSDLFHLDPVTAQLHQKTAGSLDSEMHHRHNLTLVVSDGEHKTTADLYVMVADINDNAPRFLPSTELRVSPEERVGTVVGWVEAVDRDTSPGNGDVAYYLQGGSLDKFSVHPNTGEITLTGGLLDDPYRDEYKLQIRAVDFGQPQMSDSMVLTVTVPLNKPPIVSAEMVFRVDEDQPVGTEIGHVVVSDPDGIDDQVYEITDSDVPFQIDLSGTITVTTKLDSERRDKYKFPVFVVDSGTPTHTVTTTATIYVDGVNDEKPLFSHSMYTALVEENLSLEASLKPIPITPELMVTDGDSMDGGDIVLTLEGEGSDIFTIDTVTHDLKITDPSLIDCERKCEYNLLLIATDDGGHGLQNSANLTITILDVNDNAPSFQHIYNFSIPPDTPVGTVVGVVEAVDIDGFDGNNRITYLLTKGGVGKFFVDPVSGEVLVSDSLIRPPIQDVYRLSIRAGDSGYPSLFEDTEVTVDVPNNKPAQIAEDLTLTVAESTSVGGYVGEVAVTDPDASPLYPVIFSLLDHSDTLHIDPTSGEITTVVMLDAERQSQYITRVQIEDRGIPTHVMTATVTVNIADINDNYPQFSSPTGYTVTIEENDAELETAILTLKPTFLVTDSDTRDNTFVYKLFGQYSEHFEMDERSGVITLAPDTDIDCERVCEYNLKINVTDEGGVGLTSTAPLQISVEDINDNPPNITPDVVYKVSPNATVGDVVGKVIALDHDMSEQNHQLTFTLTNGGFGKFAVGFDTGVITVADNLTREPLLDEYRLQFTVRDSGFPSLSSEALYTVHVPINKRPVFKNTKLSVDVPEDVEIGYVIADVGVDDEDSLTGGISDITYSLEGDQGLFTIDKYTGLIITAASLDAEQSASVDMTATIVDSGIPTYTGTTAVHVDIQGVNDNIPTFSSSTGYTAVIREDVRLRSTGPVEVVLTPGLAIADEDGDDVHVHLSGEGAELFAVDQTTHIITLEHPNSVDCEHQCRYNLSIIASDSGSPELTSSAELTVQIEDVNEHAPEFTMTYVYPVPAAAPVGTVVGYVEATDKDFGERNSDVSYALKSGGYDKFAVHSDTGAITVADNLIREPQLKQYDLQVEARDHGYPQRSAETTVVVKVPVNEEPVFANIMVYNVSEDYIVGDIIGTVKAEDVDLGMGEKQYLTYSIVGGDGVFSVDRRTGDIILFNDLDAESRSSYELKVKVEDHGYPSLTSTGSLIINVDDVNDNPPVFTAPQGYIARVSEMTDVSVTPIVEIVPELSVLDADIEGATENVRFGLEGVGRSDFRLDPITGQLTVHENATFDADLQQIYKLKITATDQGGTGLKSTASLNITIEDVNDNPPVFRETVEGILSPLVVDPSSPIGTVIYTFLADDADIDADNKRITYMLQSGGYGKFSVDPFSGEVKIADDLTRDPLEKDYYLTVKAIDSGAPPLSADTVLQLHVPLNTRPQPQSDVHLQVPENITVGDVVGVIYIRDFDSQADGFEYFLDTAVSEFTIDPHRGEIRTVKPLDAESRSEYILPITIIDRGFPTHTVSTTATVTVSDIDDNLPQFSALTEYTASLQEGRYDSQQELILSPGLSVWDRDISDSNSDYKVYLKGHGSDMFQITPDGSHILLKGSSMLDAENVPDYHLQIIAESVQNDRRHTGVNLTISVEDENDHAPYLPPGQEFTIDPSSGVGTMVGAVVAVDKDVVSPNSDVMYIMREDGFGKFGIDIDNGNIFVKNSLTLEPTLDLYELQVAAIDKGFPALTGSTMVRVNVPINKPITVPKLLTFSVDEDVDIGKEVGRINITQPSGGSGTVEYRLLNTGVPFTIDTNAGIIRTSSSLDADTEAEYVLEVGVANLGVPTYTSTTSVTVTVGNINDNPPQFTSDRGYTATVVENYHVTLLDVIPSVSVIDLDSLDTVVDVEYSLGGNNSDLFTINPLSAAVSIKDPQGLDAEHALVYNLTITATDENGKGLKTHADLKVKVKDVNDNSPRFDYHHVVKVDPRSPVGYEVATVKAVDDDGSPENSRLMYFLKDGVGKFRINPLTGTIFLSSRLTEEPLSSEYSLGVRVVDSGFPPQTAETTVKVLVELNQPARYELTQDFHVTENRPSGTMVGILDFSDPDGKALEFTSLDHSVPLSVDRTTGMIQTTASLDRERSASVSLPVQVVDEGAPSFTGTIVATVHILDINDNSPTFSVADGYHGVVPETFDSHNPYTVYLNQPIVVADADPDTDLDNIQLSLTGPGSDLFRIDPASGHIVLTTPQKVDSETQATFNLTLTAVDDSNGNTQQSSVPVFIDVDDFNDNPPEFKDDFEFEVATNTPVGAEIGTVVATDRDISERNNKLTYILKSGGYGKFELDSDTGVLSLSENILREPVLGTYILNIEALDSGEVRLTGDTSVTIRVPVNSPPTIDDSFTFTVEENKPVGSVVGEVTLEDPDTASNQYETFEFAVTDEQAPFKFQVKTGVLSTKRGLDREKEEYFIVPVQVINPGAPAFTVTTTVTVTVTDVNDNAPVFSSPTGYEAFMMENTVTEFLEMSDVVNVVDADATEAHRLTTLHLSGEGSDMFILDRDSGRIRLRTPGKLDAEDQCSYNLTITATDESGGGKNSSASLTVTIWDINDNAPTFPGRYNLSIAAGTRVGEVVGTIKAVDRDIHRKNNRVTYLLRGGAFGKFDLDPDTGDIVALEKLTVEPFRHVYHLSVEAIDSGDQRLSAETVVTIKVNLNKPPIVPTTFKFKVKENQAVGSEVGRVRVTDPDLEYNDGEMIQFFTGEPGVPFMVERETGIVRMATELDRETNDHFEMSVIVVNEGSPSYTATTHIVVGIVDLNDNAPMFSASQYVGRVVEDQDGKQDATEVDLDRLILVSDEDITEDNRGVVLTLTGVGSDQFRVDSDTGHLYVNRPGIIDCEHRCQYNLMLYATDQNGKGLTSSANLTIKVEDVNDHSPEFEDKYEFTVNTGAPKGAHIGVLEATDRDDSVKNNQLTYFLTDGGHGKFDVNPTTGELYVSDTLKREPYHDVFNLHVQAVDNGFPRRSANTTVKIYVPMNKAPTVDKVMSLTMMENLPAGTMVGKVEAVDPDMEGSPEETLEYLITDTSVPIMVDKYSGELKLKSSIDREELDSVSFNVHVVNDGAPAYTMSTLVTITVNDTNDHAPEFTVKGGYSGVVSETVSTSRGDVYVKLSQPITIEDKDDTSENRNVKVSLTGHGSDNFEFVEDTGRIKIRDPSLIDAELQKSFNLKLTATDQGGHGFSTSANISITVDDINDNRPVFVSNTTFNMNPSAMSDSKVGMVRAKDADATAQNNRITYLLIAGGHGKFTVDSRTGEIFVTDSPNHESMLEVYHLDIRAQDNGVPQMSADTVVTVNVPINHPPRMSLHKYEFHLPENNAVDAVVGRVTAVDPDIPADPHHKLTYSIDDPSGLFSIRPDTGVITANTVLDREVTASIVFDVQVKDNVYPENSDTANVKVIIIDLNDNAPVLTGGSYYRGAVFEDNKRPLRGQIVKLDRNISVIDHDATEVHRDFVIELEGYASRFFRYNPATGQLSVRTPGSIDREFNEAYEMKIVARDRSFSWLSSTATLRIDVADSNDNYPEFLETSFTFTLPSVVNTGDIAGKVVARDIDATEPNNKILYLLQDNPLGKFKLDINTGDLILLPSFFSKPRKDVYRVTVEARDLGYPSRKAQTKVIVRAPYFDFNDHPPDFKGETMFVTREEIPIGAVVGRLNVVDEDKEGSSAVTLELLHTGITVPFKVEADGSITCSERIDRDHGPKYYTFKVRATDNGTPPFNVTRDISVIVDDINDNPPKFPLPKYKHMVSDIFPPRTVVATPFAFDNVDERDSVYHYTMKGDNLGYFHINEKTGVVVTTDMASTLDPQTMSYQIEAVDLYNKSLKAVTELEIQVIESVTPSNSTC